MFILGDESKSNGKLPWVTFSLIAINIATYSAQCLVGPSLTRGFSLIPKEIVTGTDLTAIEHVRAKVPSKIYYINGRDHIAYREVNVSIPQAPGPFPIFLTLFTSMFLHGSLGHLIGNMWFLAIFGRNVECALDHGRFLAFYLFCGLVGGLVYTVSDPWSVLPALGASGAISGVLGAYVAIHPLNPISIWFGFYIGVIKLPAIAVLGLWFFIQYFGAFQSLEYAGTHLGGTAYWDHLGGFLAGVGTIGAMVYFLKRRQANIPPDENDQNQEATAEVQEPAQPAQPSKDDPFANFLPAETSAKS